jgi:hypothetical protein
MDIQIHPTPNPNSIKITVDGQRFIDSGMESFSTAEDAAGHALGERVFAITGVTNVFILPDFLTVTRHPAAEWDAILPKIELVLKSYLSATTE